MLYSQSSKRVLRILFTLIFISTYSFSSTLNLSISGSIGRLNPLLATDSTSSDVADRIFEGLLKYDKNGRIVGNFAKTFEFVTPTKLLIEINQGHTWHDGVEITADDVVFTYQAAINPKIFTPYSSIFRVVKDVKKISQYRVEITYTKPYFKALEVWLMSLIPYHILKDEKDLMNSEFNSKPLGNSFYIMSEYKYGQDLEFTAYKDYKPHPAKIEKTILKNVSDESTMFLMLKSKKLDVEGLTPMQVDRQIDDDFKSSYQIVEIPSKSYTYLGFNLKKKKFQDRRVREALSLAIDRKELVDILFFGHGRMALGPFLEGGIGFNPSIKAPTTDQQRAIDLLKEAGYDKNNPFEFEISTNSNNSTRVNAAQIIQYQLEKIGVKAKIRVTEWQAFLNRVVYGRNFDTALLGWSTPLMPDPYNLWHSDSMKKGGFNYISYKNESVDKLIKEAESTVNRKELDRKFQEIYRQIVEDIPYLFLYVPNSITAVNKKISPIEASNLGIFHNRIDWVIEE